jgi:hypothetical protein
MIAFVQNAHIRSSAQRLQEESRVDVMSEGAKVLRQSLMMGDWNQVQVLVNISRVIFNLNNLISMF